MGILSWWRGDGKKTNQPSPPPQQQSPPPSTPNPATELPGKDGTMGIPGMKEVLGVPGMNGAMEVSQSRLPPEVNNLTIFEFGSVAATSDKVTLAGYCPVSDGLEPCRWEIFPAAGPDAPQFRVAF